MRVDMHDIDRPETRESADIGEGDGMIAADQNGKCALVQDRFVIRGHFPAIILEIVIRDIDVAAIRHAQTFEEPLALIDIPIAVWRVSAPCGITHREGSDFARAETRAWPETYA